MKDRSGERRLRQQRNGIRRRGRQLAAVDFFNVLTSPELLDETEACLPPHRERLYPPTVTLSMFLKQVLEADGSCQQAVDAWAVQRLVEGLSVRSTSTGAYCRARVRLPVAMVQSLARETGRMLNAKSQATWRWRGRNVKLVDGTGLSMPDTADNQACYPQPSSQAPGVGFPLARLVGVLCLSSGAVLDAQMGPHAGKGSSEQDLFRRLLTVLARGDVLLADAYYCNYFMIATLRAAGVDVLFEQNGARHTDFRRGQKLGPRDHRLCWPKPKARPQWMTPEQYQAFPNELTVREIKANGKILVTTLLNHRQIPKGELSTLYAQRWHAELDLRNLKTTMGMEVLSCQTPSMVEKELWVYLLAYNLIRLLMAQAASAQGLHPRDLSFKHTVQLWIAWNSQATPHSSADCQHQVLQMIAQLRVGTRPGRIEPRARKRRPKSYPWLKVPRAKARNQLRLHGRLLDQAA